MNQVETEMIRAQRSAVIGEQVMNNMAQAWDEAAEKASTITTEELDRLAMTLKAADAALEETKLIKKEAQKKYDEAERAFITGMEMAGKKKYYVEGVGTYGFRDRMSVRTPKTVDEKQSFAKYLEEKGGKVLFWSTFGVNSQTLNAFYKAEFKDYEDREGEKGQFHIPGVGDPTSTRSLVLTKERK